MAVLGTREYGATELVKGASNAEPLVFVQTVVPYLLQVMAATVMERQGDEPIRDQHFSARFAVDERDDRELDDVLLAASVRSLEKLAETDPESIRSLLEELAADPHDGSQFLLYRALSAGGEHFADWAASLLLEGDRRLKCGYILDSYWVARELVVAIAPHVTDEINQQFEDLFRDLRNEHETRHSSGRAAFTFLSALEERRLTEGGRRRLGEYQRKFNEDAPAKPRRTTAGFIGSPIVSDAARKMTDTQWLSAMAKHDSAKTNWSALTGGAREQSHILKEQVVADPARFARLALQLAPSSTRRIPMPCSWALAMLK